MCVQRPEAVMESVEEFVILERLRFFNVKVVDEFITD